MKKLLLLLLISIIILITNQCTKNNKKSANQDQTEESYSFDDSNIDSKINIDEMKKKVKESTEMDVEVFFAISVLHKDYISRNVDEMNNLPEDEQKKFFEKKKTEFFNTIKYSEKQYEDFLQNHAEELIQYSNKHKEFQEYFKTIN